MNTGVLFLVFAVSFTACVLCTPLVTRIAIWAGAIDRPDHFRRVHKGATPRMGGLGVAFGLALSIGLLVAGGYLRAWDGFPEWLSKQWAIVLASLVVLIIGAWDDARGIAPRLKLAGQAFAVLVLFAGGIQISRVAMLGMAVELSYPTVAFAFFGSHIQIAIPSLLVTLFWFLGCMNVWNLIDGMDGLASGVGLLVTGTLMLIAVHQENWGAAILAAALAGSLAGFLLYNWHPACIFLGDSGSMLIGLMVGVIGVQYSLKKTSAVSLLFPILAMGLPISDTAMAIFRRWVRNLPLTAADRRHVHHLLMGLGLGPRQAAILLYTFSAGLCGVVLMGVAFDRELLAVIVGLSGCVAFLFVLTSRRDELANLRADFVARFARRKQERFAAGITWDAIQKIELCERVEGIWDVLQATTRQFGCESLRMSCFREGREVFVRHDEPGGSVHAHAGPAPSVAGPSATFRLCSGQDLVLSVGLQQAGDSALAADIAFRFLQRLSLATAERLERLLAAQEEAAAGQSAAAPAGAFGSAPHADHGTEAATEARDAVPAGAVENPARDPFGWFRWAFGSESAPPEPAPSLGED